MLCTSCQKKDCVKREYYCDICCKIIDKEIIPKTTSEWKQTQTTKPPLLHYTVKSESSEYITYNIEFFKEHNCYTCECLSFKYQMIPHKIRTCKHIISVRGIDNEQNRIVDNGGVWRDRSKKPQGPKRVLVLDI